ncbi:polymorphic toxin-type HINT domain-containing protein [Streptomyces sp. S.PB5]|uniref:polymorphic toxin-type HINT domain-containing protein n=1 Tax=Streptomyces sp. S.PB5 TaxID=3020844 RepID=UPI0025B1A245|nr:polymorphic toxin-type HINT domain-containing protein [Streptomyces sp. S.PB5]MDN3024438.1 polymorphic toxin-type HINT domain-containing protein [Streptomyces sp. S.PB5]
MSAVLVGTLLQGAFTPSVAQADDLPKVPASEKALSGHTVKSLPRGTGGQRKVPAAAPRRAWPKAGSAMVTLRPGAKSVTRRAGTLPVSLTAPAAKGAEKAPAVKKAALTPLSGTATVRVLDEAAARNAGVEGLLFSLRRGTDAQGAKVGVSVDYSAFAQSYGGAYAARLKLVRLPACAVTTPQRPKCRTQQPIDARNDGSQLSGDISITGTGPMMLAATTAAADGASSDNGDYTASQLSPSATWSTSLNSGSFSWSYDMPVPGVPGKFAPSVGLSYSSGAIDGRTSATNNQSSWAGDGFSLWPGSIERSYKSCAEDDVKNADGNKPGDMCWAYDNATISFNGRAGELIPTGTDTFRIKGDDGTKIQRVHGTTTDVRSNGARDDEYWKVTTTDGTQYFFGYNRLPGWASGKDTTESTWTTPVYGDDEGEPCHAATFADSWCRQAYRWNLDYAVDVHGNAIAYYYEKESNYYARNITAADETAYDRGGYLDRIEYGLRKDAVYSAKALAKVSFTSAERCLPQTGVTCDASKIDDQKFYWYDTPWDLNCKAGEDCTKSASPSFWTRKRLTGVTTQVLKSDGTYTPIDTWTLDHRWGMADIDYQLLLDSIQHTGKSATPEITLPKVTFGYHQDANRLDIAGDDTAPFIKERLSTIADESGGQIDVNYSAAACDAGDLPAPQTNTTRCYPVYFTKSGDAGPTLQWFNKYVVESVTETDRTNSSPDMVTRYDYLDGAAWHYADDDGLTKEKYKTWSQWRGYGHIRERTGGQDPVGMKSQTDHYFLRGMDGDRKGPSTADGTKSVTVSDDNGGTITDHDSAAGFEYKTEEYSGPSGRVLEKTVSTPWHHQTASRVRVWGTTTANLTGTASVRTWTSLDDGVGDKWRQTYRTNSYENTAGRVTQLEDFGDTGTAADDQCTRTSYVDNTTAWILTKPSRVETVAVKCAATPNRAKDVLSDIRTAYDGQAYDAAPTKGDPTRIASLKSHNGTTATYLESGVTYDTTYGRQLTSTDITGTVTATQTGVPTRTDRSDGRTTTTVYDPTAGFPTTVTVTSPPATPGTASTAQTSKTTYDTRRGLPVTVLDTNNKRTDTTYDALGRSLKIWLPNRSQANNQTPNYEFDYTITDGKPVAVATKTLTNDGGQRTSYTLYDGFLRARQTQAPGPSGGRLINDVFYDERGLTAKVFAPYYNTGAPSTDLLKLDDALAVETQTWNTYDGLGRVTKSRQVAGNGDGGTVLATTSTSYGGDRTTVTPPAGGTPSTTVTDARGRTTDLLQYDAATPTGTPSATHYDYDPAGRLSAVTDSVGNQWSYSYDQRGNKIGAKDPDKGETTYTYDDRNQLLTSTDDREPKQTITHVYDGLGRELETHDGTATGPLLTKHVWDPAGYEGQLSTATRYVGGVSGSAYTTTYSLYDTLYRANRVTTTIPSSEGALAGAYQSNIKYNFDGTVQSSSYPAVGSLAAEVLTPTYDDVLRPVTLSGTGGVTYITGTTYSYTGKPLQFTYQSGGKKTQVNNSYQWGTQRLYNTRVDREGVPGVDKSSTFGYDEAGNITSISDVSRDGTDNQCFRYDHLGRLTEAWAQGATGCSATAGSLLGGPAPYWQSYTYDATGNRRTETLHDNTGDAAKDVKRTYDYPAPKSPRPHGLTQVTTAGPGGTAIDTYSYDRVGNTRTRTIGGDQQTLDWDAEGHLSKVTEGTKTTSYVYDADGNRLIRRTDADTTLYLGSTEVTVAKAATTAKATRYYDLGGGNQAIRTDDGKLSFLIGDHHGTSELAVNATDLSMQQRRSTPFGAARGQAPTSWPGQRGFIGGTDDTTTGLVHLGAREYDTTTGRFISVDPVMDSADPQQMNGYSYTENNPVTYKDPTGRTKCDAEPELCGKKDNRCNSACVKKNIEKVNKANKATEEYFRKKEQKKAQKLYDYFFKPSKCVGNPSGLPKYDVCYTQAEIDSDKQLLKTVMSALGDMTMLEPWYQCAFNHNQDKCDTLGLAMSTGDAGAIARGGMRFISAMSKAGRVLCSFTSSTRVLMKGGRTKQIGKIKPGDKVEAADPKTGKHKGTRTVTAQGGHRDTDLVDLRIRDEQGRTVTIPTTFKHPFWDATAHAWIPAGELTAGHDLSTAEDGHVRLVGVRNRAGAGDMYNLTVEELHTYYVLAGSTPVLVHNCDLALGWRTMGTGEWAESKGYTHMLANPDDGWKFPVERMIGDPNVTLRVNITGWETDFEGAVRNGLRGGLATELEMSWIARAVANGQRSWNTVHFYEVGPGGKSAPAPRPAEPDWSTFGKLDPVRSPFTMCRCEGSVAWDE